MSKHHPKRPRPERPRVSQAPLPAPITLSGEHVQLFHGFMWSTQHLFRCQEGRTAAVPQPCTCGRTEILRLLGYTLCPHCDDIISAGPRPQCQQCQYRPGG